MIHPLPASRRHAARKRRGAAVLETAFVLPIVLVFILGSMDLAQVLYAYDATAEAARVGARYAMVHGNAASSPVGPSADNATVASQVKANVPALDSTRLTVHSTWGQGTNSPGSPVTVTAAYQCQLSVANLVGLGSVTVQGSTTMIITH